MPPSPRHRAPSRRPRSRSWKPWSWHVTATHLLYVPRSDGRTLICGLTRTWDGQWSAFGVEAKGLATQEDLIAHHAHKALGIFPTRRLAVRASEAFGRKWIRKAKKSRAKKCGCKEI